MATVLLDVDGVILDTSWLAKRLFEAIGLPDAYDPAAWDFGTGKLDSVAKDAFWHFFGAPKNCAAIPAYEGAVEFVNTLRFRHRLLFVTAPYDRSTTWMSERRDALVKHFGATPKEIIFAHAKEHIAGDCLLDDKPENVIDWRAARCTQRGYLFAQPYNAHKAHCFPRALATSYDRALELIG